MFANNSKFSAHPSVRADGRFSGSVSSYGMTAQLRLQF